MFEEIKRKGQEKGEMRAIEKQENNKRRWRREERSGPHDSRSTFQGSHLPGHWGLPLLLGNERRF